MSGKPIGLSASEIAKQLIFTETPDSCIRPAIIEINGVCTPVYSVKKVDGKIVFKTEVVNG